MSYAKSYSSLSDSDKKKLITDLYIKKQKSFADVAEQLGTYANKVRRDAKKLGIKIRDKSAAQQNALQTGKHKHPTLGTSRSETTKSKIGMGLIKSWEGMDDISKQKIIKQKKDQWENLSDDKKSNMIKKANEAVRLSSKRGSKLENHILEYLIGKGWRVDFHKEQVLSNTKLQIDLFLPTMNTAIEVDGPSHFQPVWGEETLAKNIKYDQKKEGLLIGKGYVLIRIKQTKDFSKTRANLVCEALEKILKSIDNKFPSIEDRIIAIKDTHE
jgi:very-short-patch-repair endonuclease